MAQWLVGTLRDRFRTRNRIKVMAICFDLAPPRRLRLAAQLAPAAVALHFSRHSSSRHFAGLPCSELSEFSLPLFLRAPVDQVHFHFLYGWLDYAGDANG